MTTTRVTIVYWRDIPAQVIAKGDGETKRLPLAGRFQEAIDMAAMRGGAESSDAYSEGWRHGEPEFVEGEVVAAAAEAVAARLEAAYDRDRLRRLIDGGGQEGV